MPTGTVDYFHETSGYGFITSDETSDDVFFHMNEVGTEDPTQGDVVRFESKDTDDGLRATEFEIVDEAELKDSEIGETITNGINELIEQTKGNEVQPDSLETLETIATEDPENIRPYLDPIADCLSNDNPTIRKKAAGILHEVGTTHPDAIAQYESQLVDCLEDAVDIRIEAAAALNQTQINQETRETVARSMISDDIFVSDDICNKPKEGQMELVINIIGECANEIFDESGSGSYFLDILYEWSAETGGKEEIRNAITKIESKAFNQAESHMETAEEKVETAEHIHSRAEQTDNNPYDFTEAIDTYEEAKAAYEAAYSVLKEYGLNVEQKADCEEEIKFIESCIASCQLSRIKRRKRNYINILQRNPKEAYSSFETLLEDIDDLAESTTTPAIASSVETHKEETKEGLWYAYLESIRQDIQTVNEAPSPRAIRKIKRVRERLDENETPGIDPPEECIELEVIDGTLKEAREEFITQHRDTAQAKISEVLSQFSVVGSATAETKTIQQAELPAVDSETTEATISQWHVSPGDTVGTGEELVTVRTQTTEYLLSMPVEGTIKELKVPPTEVTSVGSVLMTFKAASAGSEGNPLINENEQGDSYAKIELTIADSEPSPAAGLACPNCGAEPDSPRVTRGMVCPECGNGYLSISGCEIELGDE